MLSYSSAARSVLIALAAVIAAACWSPTSPDAVAGKPFDLKVGSTATLPDGLRIKFDHVTADSRCPSDVQCVRAGEAIIVVSLVMSNGSPETREMRTDATGSQISYADHTIQLTALAPSPRSTPPIDPRNYVATFVVQVR
jgi:hypothetical protein